MQSSRFSLLAVFVALGWATSVEVSGRTVTPADYSAIEKRNPFGLVDPPKPEPVKVPEEPVEQEPPPNVELTGMFHDSLKNRTYALFLVQVQGEQKKRSYMLPEGDRQDGLEVEEIDRQKGNVKIKVKGIRSTITYNERTAPAVARSAATPRPNGRPNVRSADRASVPVPTSADPSASASPDTGLRQFTTSGRQGTFVGRGRSVNAVGGGMSTPNVNQVTGVGNLQSTAASGLQSIPSRQLRTQPSLTREEQEVLIEAQRAARDYQRQTSPGALPPAPPLPPTSLSTPDTLRRITVQPDQRNN